MGQGESQLASVEGFQVARVVPRSPAHLAGLVPFFDLITAIDHRPLSGEAHDFFKAYLQKSADTSIVLTVFNLRVRGYREVPLTPTLSWGGPGLLGCSIEWTTADRCLQNTWHVLDVFENSPGSKCPEMTPQVTYILGMQLPSEDSLTLLRDEQDFHGRVDQWKRLQEHHTLVHHQKDGQSQNVVVNQVSILFLVYDERENAVKEIIVPMSEQDPKTGAWKVVTSLGLDVGNGYLHVIPPSPTGDVPVIRKFVLLASSSSGDKAGSPSASTVPSFPEPPVSSSVPPPIVDSPASPPTPHPTPVTPHDGSTPSSAMQTPIASASFGMPVPPPTPVTAVAAVPQPTATGVPSFLPPPLKFPTFPPPPTAPK